MIGIVRSFNPLSETPQTAEGPARTLRLMRWHCALAGVILFVAGVAIASVSWQALLAAIGAVARSRLTPRFMGISILVGNAIVVLLGLQILFTM